MRPWIDVIEEGEAPAEVKEAYARIVRERGKLSNVMKVQGLNAEAMRRHFDLYVSLLFGRSGLTRPERELIAVVVSSANRCEYCITHHAESLRAYWKDGARGEAAARDWRGAALSERERALASYADKLTRAPGEMVEEDVASLREAGLADRDILDVNMIAAYFNFVNRIAAGLGVEFSFEEARGYKK